MNTTFDRIMTACLLALALSASFVAVDSMAQLNRALNAQTSRSIAMQFVAQK